MVSQISSLSPVARGVVLGAALLVLLLGVRAFAPIINPLLFSVLIAILLMPVYARLLTTRLPNSLALVLTLLLIVALGLGLLLFVRLSLGQLIDAVPTYQAVLDNRIEDLQTSIRALGISVPEELGLDIDLRQVTNVLLDLLGNLTGLLTSAILIFVMVGAWLSELPRIRRKLSVSFGEESALLQRLHLISQSVQSYLGLRTKVNVITGSSIGVLLLVLGTDFAILWGLLAIALSYIPYIGLVIAAIPPVLLTWLEFGLLRALLVVVGVTAINIIVEDLVSPAMMSRSMSLAPVVVLGSILFWGFELGLLGFLLSVPLTVIFVYVLDAFDETRWIAMLMSGDSPDEPRGDAANLESAHG